MITEPELLKAWQRDKAGLHAFWLVAEAAVAFEYEGPQFGHPSNYAAIKIIATPSPNLCLESVVVYPSSSRRSMRTSFSWLLPARPATSCSRPGGIRTDASWSCARWDGMRL